MTATTFRIHEVNRSEATGTIIGKGFRTLKLWHDRARQRRHLAALTTEQLDDVGIRPSEARTEAAKPMWVA